MSSRGDPSGGQSDRFLVTMNFLRHLDGHLWSPPNEFTLAIQLLSGNMTSWCEKRRGSRYTRAPIRRCAAAFCTACEFYQPRPLPRLSCICNTLHSFTFSIMLRQANKGHEFFFWIKLQLRMHKTRGNRQPYWRQEGTSA
jgi:hypothetical protein